MRTDAPAFPPYFEASNTALRLDGTALAEVAAERGTPVWAFSRARVEQNFDRLLTALRTRYERCELAYSVKANNARALIQLLHARGAKIDASAEYELHMALAAGVPAGDVILNGNAKSAAALSAAAELGVRQVNVDSLEEVRRLDAVASAAGRRVSCLVRLHLTYAELLERDPIYESNFSIGDGKFGCYIATGEAMAAVEAILASKALDFLGLSHHVGFSGYYADYSPEREILHHELCTREVVRFANAVYRRTRASSRRLDLGGGLRGDGLVARSLLGHGEDQLLYELPSLADYTAAIFDPLEAEWEGDELPLVQFEVGGFLVGDAAVLLTTVQEVKDTDGGPRGHLRYIAVDSSMMMFVSRGSLALGYPVALVTAPLAEPDEVPVEIVGQTCVYDTIADGVRLPIVHPGDVLAILDQGAYCDAEGTQFNGVPRPEVVLLDAGTVRVARRRETLVDVMARDEVVE
jgi:diaminopimelate decarboxylase